MPSVGAGEKRTMGEERDIDKAVRKIKCFRVTEVKGKMVEEGA